MVKMTLNVKKYLKKKKKIPRKKGLHQPINSLGALGLLKTYHIIFKDAIKKNLDYVAMVEDDNYFHPLMIKKIRNSISLLDKNDIIWIGSNQCFYNKKQLNRIKNNKNYQLDNCPIAGTFFIIFSKKIYTEISKYLCNNFERNIYPIDVLLDLTLKKSKLSAIILYPRPVIPEVRDSDNMGPRNYINFYKMRKINNFDNYDCFDLYDTIMKNYSSFSFEMYKSVYDKLEYYSIRKNKPKIGNLTILQSRKILESNYKTFNIIVSNTDFLDSVISQKYFYWRITLKNIDLPEKYFKYKKKINFNEDIDDDEIVIALNKKMIDNMVLHNINFKSNS